MNGRFRFKRRRMMSYCLGMGFAMGLGHKKQEWRKERYSDCFNRIPSICCAGFLNLIFFQWKILYLIFFPMENTVRDVIDVQKQVALTIYWLATPAEYRTIGTYLVWQNPPLSSAFTGSVKLKLRITCRSL